MRWRKASERLPEGIDGQRLNIKYKGKADTLTFLSKRWCWLDNSITESEKYPVDKDSWSAIEWLDESESSSPSHNDIVQEMENEPVYINDVQKREFIDKYLPKLKQIGEGSESYWKKRCEAA